MSRYTLVYAYVLPDSILTLERIGCSLVFMQTVFLLALAGACGALARHGLSLGVNATLGLLWPHTDFPWGIFVVNVLGCFLFGLIWELAAMRHLLSDASRTVLLVGFVGSFTTFSTLIFDSNRLLQASQEVLLVLNLGGQVVLGIAALRLGFWCVRTV
ncbi:MAG: CrcB family protein [Desulfovibrionaceae bacterium]